MSEWKSLSDEHEALFEGRPHGWIQWKGTEVCMDLRCSCGELGHVDGPFGYWVKCASCGQVYEVGGHVYLFPVDKADNEDCCLIEEGSHNDAEEGG